jgi:hypothetical protein
MFMLRENGRKQILVSAAYVDRQLAMQEEDFLRELNEAAGKSGRIDEQKLEAAAAQLDAA